jgi:hypothetical protein
VSLESKRKEFFDNVWDHSQDPFQTQFDMRRLLSDDEVKLLSAIYHMTRELGDNEQIASILL